MFVGKHTGCWRTAEQKERAIAVFMTSAYLGASSFSESL
jgi:hypothetical protein